MNLTNESLNVGPAPSSLEVARALARGLGLPVSLVDDLDRLHRRQWDLEDESRTVGDLAAAGRVKAAIDRSNQQRHHLIDQLDAALSHLLDMQADRLYSETPGELVDRLVITGIKRIHLAGRAAHDSALRSSVALIDRKVAHLEQFCLAMCDDILRGRAMLPPRAEPKLYRTGPEITASS